MNRELWADPGRPVAPLLNLWVPGGLVVGCEALFVPYAGDRAGFLYAAAALGMLAGDIVVGRFLSPAWRRPTGPRPTAAARPALPGLRAVAGAAAGRWSLRSSAQQASAAGLPLQERLIVHSPAEIRGQVLGLHHQRDAGHAGVVCRARRHGRGPGPGGLRAVALLATASLAATLVLTAGLRRTAPAPVEAVR